MASATSSAIRLDQPRGVVEPIQTIQPQLQAQIAKVDELSNKLNEALKAKQWVVAEFSQFKVTTEKRHRSLEQQIEQMRKEVKDSSGRLQEAEKERDALTDKGRVLQTRLHHLERDIEATQSERGQLLREVNKTQTVFAEAVGTVENLKGDISRLTIEIKSREAEQKRLAQVAAQRDQDARAEKGKRWDLLLQERNEFYGIGNVALFGQYVDSWVHFRPNAKLLWQTLLPDTWTGRTFSKEAEFAQLSRELGRAVPPKPS